MYLFSLTYFYTIVIIIEFVEFNWSSTFKKKEKLNSDEIKDNADASCRRGIGIIRVNIHKTQHGTTVDNIIL